MSVEGSLWRDVCSLECGRRRREAARRDTEKANCCYRGTIGIKRRESNRPPFESSYDSAFTRVTVTSWSFQVALKTFARMQRKIISARSFAKIFREKSFDFCILWEKRDWKCVYKLQNIYCQHMVLSRKPVYGVKCYLKRIILGGCVM